MKRLLVAVMFLVASCGGAQDEQGSAAHASEPAGPVKVINPNVGAACTSSDQCVGLSEAYCSAMGVCTRRCEYHSDCGCAGGTTGTDIASGGCRAACIDIGMVAVCLGTCLDDSNCPSPTKCMASTGGYKVCR